MHGLGQALEHLVRDAVWPRRFGVAHVLDAAHVGAFIGNRPQQGGWCLPFHRVQGKGVQCRRPSGLPWVVARFLWEVATMARAPNGGGLLAKVRFNCR